MDGHRAGSGVCVILAQERIVGRSEECFSAAGGHTSHEYEHHNACCKSCEHGRNAPEEDRYGGHPLAAEAVAGHSSERHHECVAEVEYGGDETYRCVSEVERVTDCREHRVEHLTVCLVEQICHPEESQNLPFIVLVSAFHRAENVFFKFSVV